MTLTAEAAHQLYARAWAVAPETRPQHEDGDLLAFDCGGWCWRESISEREVDLHAALALCRTAAEDWLRTRGAVHWCGIGSSNLLLVHWPYGGYWTTMLDEEPYAPFTGPTIHHALVLAVEAVAAGKAVRA